MAAEIAVSTQQTRFFLPTTDVFSGLDIKGLTISVLPPENADSLPSAATQKGKGKARANGVELLSGAELKLVPGERYALIGKNGSGKSSFALTNETALLRAIADHLIPGMPRSTRVAILQQNSAESTAKKPSDPTSSAQPDLSDVTPLQLVLSPPPALSRLKAEFALLARAIENPESSNPIVPVRVMRKLRLDRVRRELVEAEKMARLRSGARGKDARKEVISLEERVKDCEEALNSLSLSSGSGEPSDAISVGTPITKSTVQEETQAALDLYNSIQLQLSSLPRQTEQESRATSILTGLGFTAARRSQKMSVLSGGWRMRAQLAAALFQDADILILDEPTNFLDLFGIVWLQRFLDSDAKEDTRSVPATNLNKIVLLVSHDRAFVDAVCPSTLILRDQAITPFAGPPTAYESDLRSRIQHMSKMKEAADKQASATQRSIAADMRDAKAKGNDNKARAAKTRQKRLDERSGLQISATGGRFKLNRDLAGYHNSLRDEIEVPTEERGQGSMCMPEPAGLRFPGSLVALDKVSWRYPSTGSGVKGAKPPLPALVVEDLSLVIHPGDRIGIMGLNGSGKSTLIRVLEDTSLRPVTGSVQRHPNLVLGYYAQHAVEQLQDLGRAEPSLTALGLLMREVDGALQEGEVRALLGMMGLPGRTAADTALGKLSGGQLVRAGLARVLWKQPNLLVLDEVSTHLDHFTVKAIAEGLRGWKGAVVLVSHDRWLVREVVEGGDEEDEEESGAAKGRRMVFLMRKGKLRELNGGVQEFEDMLTKRLDSRMS